MSSGIGISPDSVIYLSAADSINAGTGFKAIAFHYSPAVPSGEPLISFPPTYPLLLSLTDFVSADRLNGVRWLHTFLFAATVLLIAIFVYLGTEGSVSIMVCAIFLFESSPPVLDTYTMAWSEPPFVLFVLLAMILLLLYLKNPHYLLLAGSSVAVSLALTTRYLGITVLPPMILALLLLLPKPWNRRIRDCVFLLGIGTLPLGVWLIRNLLVANSATHRSMAFHPLGRSDIGNLIHSFQLFWLPVTVNVYVETGLLFLVGGGLFWGVFQVLRDCRPQKRILSMTAGAVILSAGTIVTYLAFLVAYNSLVDPAVDSGSRVLAPVYILAIILMSIVVYRLGLGDRKQLRWGFLALSIVLISINGVRAFSFARERRANGTGFTSRGWVASKSIEYVRTLPEPKTIYSNGIDAIHFLATKQALRIPAKTDPTGGKTNPEFDGQINALRNELMQNRAVVVYLDRITWRWYLPSKDELENVYRLPILVRLDDGVVYGIK